MPKATLILIIFWHICTVMQESIKNTTHLLEWKTCAERYHEEMPASASSSLNDACNRGIVMANGKISSHTVTSPSHTYVCCYDLSCCNVESEAR